MRVKRVLGPTALLLALLVSTLQATYSLPADRTMTWANSAGLDPVGGIPSGSWTTSTCNGLLTGSGNASANSTTLNNCISAAAANTVVLVPSGGPFYLSAGITMKSNVVLRGPGTPAAPWMPTATADVIETGSGKINFSGGGKSTSWDPATTFSAGCGFNCVPHGTLVASGYSQGSSSVTLTTGDADPSSTYAVGDYIAIYQNKDASATTLRIDDQNKLYLGEDCGSGCISSEPHAHQQYAKITAVSGTPCTGTSGCTVTFTPAIYDVSDTPTGAAIRRQTFTVATAGLEQLRIQCDGTSTSGKTINIHFARDIWVKDVETYNCGGSVSSGSPHVWTDFSLQVEIRDSYFHTGLAHTSGANYGLEFYNWNSAHKLENNIIRDTRHCIVFEGGGSGMFVAYNYCEANYEDDGAGNTDFLSEDCVPNHGAHPHMHLWEGNQCNQIYGDWTQGSSTNIVLYRNWAMGWRSTPSFTGINSYIQAVRDGPYNRHWTLVGNVAGLTSWTTGTAFCNSASICSPRPIAFAYGYHTDNSHTDTVSFSSAVEQGNYDYITDGVLTWSDADHTLAASQYYAAKPAFVGVCAWPAFGPDVSAQTSTLPAVARYNGSTECTVGLTHLGRTLRTIRRGLD